MSFLLALLRQPALTLATTSPVLPAEDLQALPDALALCDRLNQLLADEGERIAQAEAQARERGWAEGRAHGEACARHDAAQQLQAALSTLAHQQQALQGQLQQAVVTLAMVVLRRLAADLGPVEMVTALLQRAFEQTAGDERWSVRVHPQLLPALRERFAAQRGDAADKLHEWVADDSLQPYDCVLESPHGRLLAGLEAELQRVQQALSAVPQAAEAEVAWTA